MTVAVCTNATDMDKVPLWFNPRCLKNINIQHLGCQYYANNKTWMAGELFRDWLIWFGKYIEPERQVVLILDNFSGHQEMLDRQIFELNIFLQIQDPNYSLLIKGLFVHLKHILDAQSSAVY